MIEDYTSGERTKKIHVHTCHKKSEKILSYIKAKHVGTENAKKPSKIFRLRSNKGS